MKIYALKPDTDFRLMYPEDDVYDSDYWEFKCEPLIGKLPKTFNAYFSEKSNKPTPDIAYIGMLTFAFRKDVATELADILEAAGELHPFTVDGELWYCLNILQKSDALDKENSSYEVDDGKTKMGLKSLAFDANKLPETSLFKITGDNYTSIYCADSRENDEQILENFFCAVSHFGYTGVKFEEVYSNEN